MQRPRSLSLYSEEEQIQRTNVLSTVPTPPIEPQLPPFVHETPIEIKSELTKVNSAESKRSPTPEPASQPTPMKLTENQNYISIHSDENKTSSNIKASPSCAQEVTGNQNGHLDLKFYHSPLW